METKHPPLHPLVLTVIAVGLLCRLVFLYFTPAFCAPDEHSHFNYVKQLVENHAFPVMAPLRTGPANTWENCQSPLYYLSLVPLYRVAESVFAEPTAAVRLLRSASVLLWLFNIWLGMTLLRRLQIKDVFTWVFVMGMASLLPTYTFTSSSINNDNLLEPLCGVLLCLVVRRKPTLGHATLLGLVLGCALLTKQSAAVFVPMIVLLTAQDCFCQRVRWSTGAAQLGVTLVIGGLMYAPWVLRNWHLYHTLTPELLADQPKVWPSAAYGIASAIHNLTKTFWAVSGVANDISYPFPLAGMLLLLLIFIAPHLAAKPALEFAAPEEKASRPVTVAFSFAVLLYIALALKFGYFIGMGQGRYLFPVLFPIALLLAARLRRLPVKNLELWLTGFWVAYAVSFMIFSLCRFPDHYAILGS